MLTIKQAAAELGVPARTINHHLATGVMRGERVDGWLWLIPRDEVERRRAEGRRKPGRKVKNA